MPLFPNNRYSHNYAQKRPKSPKIGSKPTIFHQKQSEMKSRTRKKTQKTMQNQNPTVLLGATWQRTTGYKFPKTVAATCQRLPWWNRISLNTE
jgi:hypothetical protein